MTAYLRPARRVLLQASGGAVTLGLLMPPAMAEELRVERVEVTGTAIRRISAEAALPVRIITAADISRSGATSVADLLQALPGVQAFMNDAGAVGQSTGGYANLSLHGLGDTRTLVLIGGRRVASFAGQSLTGASAGVDVNSIPLAAVERIEVLSDGASAVYGSDAIAGVVNVILKRGMSGVEVDAGTTFTQGGGASERRASVTAGRGDLEVDRFNIMVSASHEERSALDAARRSSFAVPASGYYEFDSIDGRRYRRYVTSGWSVPGNVLAGSNASGSWGAFSPTLLASSSCSGNSIVSGQTCRYVYPADLQILPEAKRDGLLARFDLKLSENFRVFSEALYSRHELTARIAPAPGTVLLKAGSPYYAQYLQPYGVPVEADALVAWRLGDAGRRATRDVAEATHLSAGFSAVQAGWDTQASLTHSLNRWTATLQSGYLYSDALRSAIGSGLLNPFVPVGQQSAAAKALIDAARVSADYQYRLGTTYLDAFQIQASRELFSLPAGGVQLGVGFDIRRERDRYEPSALAQGLEQGGVFPDQASDASFDVARTTWGAFAEVLAPLARHLEASAALRHDHYSDFGATSNAKLGARWNPIPEFLLRASINTGFHAPQPAQMSGVTQRDGVTAYQYSCPFAAGDPRSAFCASGATEYPVYISGNPDLKPEKSVQATVGFRVEPTTWASLGADYWRVRVIDQFGSGRGETQIAGDWSESLARGDIRPIYVDALTGQTRYAFILTQVNRGERQMSGIDFDLRFAFRAPPGRIASRFTATWTLVDQQQLEKGGVFYSSLGKYDPNVGGPTLRLQASWQATLSRGAFDHSFTVHYRGAYDEVNPGSLDIRDEAGNPVSGATPHRVEAWFPVDWQSVWKTPLAGVRLTAGLANVFNKKPPLSILGGSGQVVGYNAQIADPRGRTCYLNADYRF